MRRRVAIPLALVAAVAVTFAVMAATISPPGLLSIADAMAGGGWGVSRPGSDIAFGTTGQTLDVWVPYASVTQPRPVLIFWYGGGWVKGDRRAYAFAARAYANAGFVVVVPDYRKVPAIRFPAMLQDGAQVRRLGAAVTLIDYRGLSHEDVAMALSKPFRAKGPVLADSVAFLNRVMPPRH